MTGGTILLHHLIKTIKPIVGCRPWIVLCLLSTVSLHAFEYTPSEPQKSLTQNQREALQAGSSTSASLSGGETKEYSLKTQTGQHVRLEIMKTDLRLKVSACIPSGNSCFEFTKRSYGKLDASFTTSASAEYVLAITSLERDAVKRGFELKIVEILPASDRHRFIDAATAATSKAEILSERLDLSSRLAAISKYNEAGLLWQSAGENGEGAEALCNAGDIYFSLSRYKEALTQYQESLALNKDNTNRLVQLAALNGIGYMHANLGNNDKALHYALRVQETLKTLARGQPSAAFKRIEAQATNTIGEVHYARRQLKESIAVFSQTLPLWRGAEDRSGEALALLNLGYSHADLGDFRKASELYEQARKLFGAVSDERGVALAQTARAGALSILGQPQFALDLHQQALQHFRSTANKQGEAAALNGIASAYEDLSEYQSAVDNYLSALRLYEEIGNKRLVALNKFVIGRALYQLGELDDAEKYCLESLDLSRHLEDRVIEANVLQSLAAISMGRNDIRRALAQGEMALKLYRVNENHWSEAYALNDLGHFHASSGDSARAFELYRKALPLMRASADRHGEALTLVNLGKIERDRGNLTAALSLTEESLKIAESLHREIRNTQLRTSFFTSVQQQYEIYVSILMRLHQQFPTMGYDRQALVANERSRSRSLLDSLLAGKVSSGQEPASDLVSKELELLRRLDEKAEQQRRILARKHTQEESDQISQEIRSLTIEYQDVRSKLKEQNSRHSTLTHSAQLRAEDLQAIVQSNETFLLVFGLGETQSYLWAVSHDKIASYELPSRETIETLARRVYDLLVVRATLLEQSKPVSGNILKEADADYWQQAHALSIMLLGPVAGELESRRLLVVGDGFLQYLPFDALPAPDMTVVSDERQPLFLNHEVICIPSALVLAALRQPENRKHFSGKTIAILADPVFEPDDPRVAAAERLEPQSNSEISLSKELRGFGDSDAPGRISRLPSTLREARAIIAVSPQEESVVRTGFMATKQQVVSGELNDYRIIHFATHGLLNSEHPELSGIVLSLVDEHGDRTNGFLRINDIYNLRLQADLIVLSACRTGLGKTLRGEGVIGLPSAFMYAGAKSVVASGWKVDDEATAELMSHFYAALFRDGLPPAAALRKAKIELWKQERWHAPFYWGAFVFQGEYEGELARPSQRKVPTLAIVSGMLALLAVGVGAIVWRKRSRLRKA